MSGKALGDWPRRFQGKDVRELQPCGCSPRGFVSSIRVFVIPEQLSRVGYDSWPKYGTLGFNKRPFLAASDHANDMDASAQLIHYMRDALPNASFIGFTGTPIELTDKNTRAVFGDYIHIYDIQQAVEDKATVPIYYESRLARLALDENERPHLDEDFEEATESEELSKKEKLKTKWAALEALVGAEKRINLIAKDLIEHFEERLAAIDGKAMVVCMSRRICVKLYDAICRLRPDWIEVTQVIEELIALARELRAADKRGEDLGLTEDEIAFYDALEVNDSAVKVLGDETLKTIAQELVEVIRRNLTIDWTVKASVQANLRINIKRILRKYGYPPDKQEKATRTVFAQAELLCADWSV